MAAAPACLQEAAGDETTGLCVADDDALFEWHWRDEVDSTMDEARRLLEKDAARPIAVAAARQRRGRGTRGREWRDGDGNAKVTVALPVAASPLRGAAVTLLPLRVGTLVHAVLARYLEDDGAASTCVASRLRLKWPNDVLLGDAKVAGTLVEMDGDHLLIGVGVNLATAPAIPTEGPNAGRRATSLSAEHCDAIPEAETVSKAVARAICAWAAAGQGDDARDAQTAVLDDWTRLADWRTPLRLRDAAEEHVLPLRLLDDGRLLVRPLDGGADRALVAEYLV